MGRSYREELGELSTVLSSVPSPVTRRLREAALQASTTGLIVVASGGAKVVAEWACRLHRMALGSPAVALTPLEFVAIEAPVRATTWLLSAGGRHPDIHRAAQAAKQRGDDAIVGVIGQSQTPLEKWLAEELSASSITLGLAAGVDGFLATNSVWAMACTLVQAYGPWLAEADGSEISTEALSEVLQWARHEAVALRGNVGGSVDHVVLHDAWCMLGAEDLEARLIETSLANIWISDFRNFGHGRHFWMADRKNRTQLIAMWTPSLDDMAEQSLALLPAELSVLRIRVPYAGAIGSLASLAWSIHAVPYWAGKLERDPGRPGVPRFGEMLYEGQFPYPTAESTDSSASSLQRKISSTARAGIAAQSWRAAYDRARQILGNTTVRAVVLDFDGTLIESARLYEPLETGIVEQLCRLLSEGIWIGIATGRGDSVQKSLLAAIPNSLRHRVLVGYHNGACVQPLEDVINGLDGAPVGEILKSANDFLSSELQTVGLASIRARAHQLTLAPVLGQALERTWRLTKECLSRHGLGEINVWLSSHSVDVVAPECSKLNVVNQLAHLAGCSPEEIVRIGDRGAWPGNDWQLLDSPLGLSVDQCSASPDACWNFNPAGMRGTRAAQYLLSRMQRDGDSMRLLLEENLP